PPGQRGARGPICQSRALVPFLFPLPARRPVTPTLFPYTTLFRSAADGRIGRQGRALPRSLRPDRRAAVAGQGCGRGARLRRRPRDRKSTRLNSSHDQISYAVFCLKKKNVQAFKQGIVDESVEGAE